MADEDEASAKSDYTEKIIQDSGICAWCSASYSVTIDFYEEIFRWLRRFQVNTGLIRWSFGWCSGLYNYREVLREWARVECDLGDINARIRIEAEA